MLKMYNLRGLIDIRLLWGRHNLALTHFVNEMCIKLFKTKFRLFQETKQTFLESE